jgi:hypothetical protein
MNAIKIETTIQTDGELHLTELPFRKGDRVEAIVLPLTAMTEGKMPASDLVTEEEMRREALERFLARATASKFRSNGPYPTRDELHERG